jgi:hypothetical protein
MAAVPSIDPADPTKKTSGTNLGIFGVSTPAAPAPTGGSIYPAAPTDPSASAAPPSGGGTKLGLGTANPPSSSAPGSGIYPTQTMAPNSDPYGTTTASGAPDPYAATAPTPLAPGTSIDPTTGQVSTDAALPPTPGVLSGPGPGETFDATHSGDFNTPGATESTYAAHGQDPFNTPSNSQTLFNEGSAGNDPYYNYAQKMTDQSVNAAARARGGWNSGATLETIGLSDANLRGQQAQSIYNLAPQADSAERQRLSQGFDFANQNDTAMANRVGAGQAINDDWQTQEQNRLTGGLSSATTLANDKADTTSAAYQSALGIYNTDGLAGIESALQKAGINPTGDATKDLISLIGLGVKAGTGGK